MTKKNNTHEGKLKIKKECSLYHLLTVCEQLNMSLHRKERTVTLSQQMRLCHREYVN